MRYVITGASGHIGNNLVRLIAQKEPSAEILLLTRRPITKEIENIPCKQVVGNLSDVNFLREHITSSSFVVHLAGVVDLTNKKKEECQKVNVLLTKTICDVCQTVGVQKFIYVGSVDGIDKSDAVQPIREPLEYYPEKIQGNYGQSKAEAMRYVWRKIQTENGFNAAMVLPSAVIGVYDYKPSAVGRVVLNTLLKKPQLGLDGGYNFVNVKDVSAGIFALLHTTQKGQFILSGENVTVREMYVAINKIKGWRKKPIIFPNWLVNAVAPFTKILSPITLKALREPHDYSSE
ncbi:MAG: NAD-dependent epimerase/dehydratase family protein, partial [Clostridia bacterium]|nr:NAD-dependent epimerase/dehydratase family protein [Clostridia bacterium]